MKSMTGYGRELAVINGREILTEIRTVNHRYFEFSAKVPRAYGFLEEKLKVFLQAHIARGKTDVFVSVNNLEGKEVNVKVNTAVAESYIGALRNANGTLGLDDNIRLMDLLKFQDIFKIQKVTEDEEEIWADVKTAAEAALERISAMREREGAALSADISARLSDLERELSAVEDVEPALTDAYMERLHKRLSDVLEDKNIDEQRVLTECAIFAEKISVAEETVRLRSHISQFREFLLTDGQTGRKLDFLVQEMNREVNTIGSKIQDAATTKKVIEMKSLLEKIREQIQNVE